MSEEQRVTVTDEEIKQVEQQINQQQKNTEKAIEERVKREMLAEQRAKELEAKLSEQQRIAEEAKQEATRAKQEAESFVKQQVESRLRAEQEMRSKQFVNTTNPFKTDDGKPRIERENIPSIDRASYEAFLEKARKPR